MSVAAASAPLHVPCVVSEEAVCMCAVLEGRVSVAPHSLFYALNGLGSLTAVVCRSQVLRDAGLRRAVYCDRARVELRVEPRAMLPYLRLCWLNDRGKFDFAAHTPQLINHFSNEYVLTQKHELAKRLLTFQRRHATRVLHPDTLDLSLADDARALLHHLRHDADAERYWIVKPVNDSSGRGISVVRSEDELRARYPGVRSDGVLAAHLAQRYMTRPLLLQGCKFNTRVYLFIAQLHPARVYWHPGYITKAIARFDLSDTSLDNLCAHVSNTRLQKLHPEFEARKDEQKWTWAEFAEHVVQERLCSRIPSAAAFVRRVEHVIAAKLAALMLSVHEELDARAGQFALFGVDFLFDADGEPLLIECNKAPSHSASHRGTHTEEAQLVPRLVDDALRALLALQRDRDAEPAMTLFRRVDLTVLERHDRTLFGGEEVGEEGV